MTHWWFAILIICIYTSLQFYPTVPLPHRVLLKYQQPQLPVAAFRPFWFEILERQCMRKKTQYHPHIWPLINLPCVTRISPTRYVTSVNNYLVHMGFLWDDFSFQVGTLFTTCFELVSGKRYFKPVFGHSYVIIIIHINFKLEMWPKGGLSCREATLEWDSCLGCENEAKTHFTFPLIYIRETGYFMVMFLWHKYEWLYSS